MPRRPGSGSGLHPPTAPPNLILARDYAPDRIARMVADGSTTRLRRGAYQLTTGDQSPEDRALARIVAVHHLAEAEHCFSHRSAALLHGLRLWRRSTKVDVYQAWSASGRAGPDVTRRVPLPPPEDRAIVVGMPATALARTAWDCMASLPAPDALVVADAALHAGISADALASFARPGARGHARASAILRHADDGPESAPESICRFRLLRAGFPVPTTQIPVETRLGTFWGDLGWEEWRVLIEYDGRAKYEERPTEAVFAEKRRHDALVEVGWRAIRVTKEDLATAAGFEARVRGLLPASATRGLRRRRELTW